MSFIVHEPSANIIRSLWDTIVETVDGLIARLLPGDAAEPILISRPEASALATALSLFEAAVRRILVVVAAELGPRRFEGPLPDLPFRIEECPPTVIIRTPPPEDPDWFLKPPPGGGTPPPAPAVDELVPSDAILKRLEALEHAFDNWELYVDVARDRLCAPLPPLHKGIPKSFKLPHLSNWQVIAFGELNATALEAQAFNSS